MLNEAGLKAAVRAAQETVFGNGVPVWEDDFPPIRAALTAYLASVQGEQKPVAWRHTLHMDGAETAIRLARAEVDRPWGRPGIDYDKSFSVSIEPLFTHPADRDGVEADWRLITDDDRPPNDTDVFMGCWQRWPDDKWLVEYGLYGSTKGGWIHGRMTHWLPSSILPTPPASALKGVA